MDAKKLISAVLAIALVLLAIIAIFLYLPNLFH